MTISSGTHLGPYEIGDLIGSGGMGEVYRARHTRLGREVAIKILPARIAADRERLGRFEKEARLASSLNHPNIVTIYDIGEDHSIPYIAMELVIGRTVREMLKSGPMPLSQVVELAMQIADGLAKAHDAGIVHRDLKPENVMVTNDGFVKILDFGLGKYRRSESAFPATESTIPQGPAMTGPGTILGTADYMSPEQAAGKDADFRSDQFSFGSLVYEMTTGHRPFHRGTAVQTMSAIIADSPPALTSAEPSAPMPLRDVIARCLAKSPEQRYQSTREIVAQLRSLSTLLQIHGAGGLPRERRTIRVNFSRRSVRVAAFLVSAVLIAFGLWRNLVFEEPLPNPKNVVVLPFRAAGSDAESQAFSNGLTDRVTAALTQMTTNPTLQVAPSSEVRTRRIANAEEARGDVGANLLVTGEIQRVGGNLRVTWNLINAATGRRLRTGSVSVPVSEQLEVDNRTIAGILETLELDLKPAERAVVLAAGTHVPAAKDAYLRARGYLQDYDKDENVSRAISLFEDARRLDPSYALAYAGLGEAYWRKYEKTQEKGLLDTARETCQKALSLSISLADGHGCVARISIGMGHYEDAVRDFQLALKSEPTNDNFRRELAIAYEKLENVAEAEKTFREAIGLRPHYWANYNMLGRFYFNQGRYKEAVEMFLQVVKLAPDSSFGYTNLGGAYVYLGGYADAIPMFERSASIRPTATAYSNLATAYFNMDRLLDAAETFEKAIKLDEKNYVIWGNLGDAYYWAEGKRELAGDAYRKAISIGEEALRVNSRDATVLSRLAVYYAMNGETQQASTYLKRALEISPKDASIQFRAAIIQSQLKDDGKALEWLEKAVKTGYSVFLIRDLPNFNHLWKYPGFQKLIRSY